MRLIEIWSHLFEAPEEDKYKKLLNAYADKPEIANAITAEFNRSKELLKKTARVMWYLKVIEAHLNNLSDPNNTDPILTGFGGFDDLYNSLAEMFQISKSYAKEPEVKNYAFENKSIENVLADLKNIKDIIDKRHKANEPIEILPGDKIILELGKFDWWLLPTNEHKPEAEKMGHCGYAQHDDNYLLSLRDKIPLPKLTFEYNQPSRTLWQMKGPHNTKPDKKYHNQIFELLMSDIVSHLTVRKTFQPDADFSIFDLDTNTMEIIQNKKPNLIKEQIEKYPFGFMNAPESIINNTEYRELAYQKLPGLKHLLDDSGFNSSLETWINAVSDSKSLILYAPNNLPNYEEILLDLVADESYSLPNHIKQNYDLMEKIVKSSHKYLTQVPIKNTERYKKIARIAIINGLIVFEKIHEKFRDDVYLKSLFKVCNGNPFAIDAFPDELKDYDMYLAAVVNGYNPDDVPDEFKSKEIYTNAVILGYNPDDVPVEPIDYRSEEMYTNAAGLGYDPDDVPDEFKSKDLYVRAVDNGYNPDKVPIDFRSKEMYYTAVTYSLHNKTDYGPDKVPDEFKSHELYDLVVKNGYPREKVPPEFQ